MDHDSATLERNTTRFTRGDTRPRLTPESNKGPNNVAHKIGPHSRPHILAQVDGRTRQAAVLRRVRDELTEHVGGNPNNVQKMLIERCAWLSVRLSLLDEKIADGKSFTQIDSNCYLAWNNSLVRTLARLGIDKRSNRSSSSLSSVLAEMTR